VQNKAAECKTDIIFENCSSRTVIVAAIINLGETQMWIAPVEVQVKINKSGNQERAIIWVAEFD